MWKPIKIHFPIHAVLALGGHAKDPKNEFVPAFNYTMVQSLNPLVCYTMINLGSDQI